MKPGKALLLIADNLAPNLTGTTSGVRFVGIKMHCRRKLWRNTADHRQIRANALRFPP